MSAVTTANGPATTTGVVSFIVPPADETVEVYFHINADPVTGERKTNSTRANRAIPIENLRGKEDSVTLDTAGFQYFHAPTVHKSFVNDDQIRKEYYPESIELIKRLTGASRVEIFDHSTSLVSSTISSSSSITNWHDVGYIAIRRRIPGQIDDSPDNRQPVPNAHVDQTTNPAIARVHRHLPASEAPELLKKRFQIINLWRPISHPAWDWPLALCDYSSVDTAKDTVPVALIFPDRKGETLGIKYSENYKWKYLYGMTPDEIVLIKW